MSNPIHITPEGYEVYDSAEYCYSIDEQFVELPDIAQPLIADAKGMFAKIESLLYSAPTFINYIRAHIPETTLQAVLSDEQKTQIAKGALRLMTKKDGSLMANLINTETGKIASTIPLENVNLSPELSQATANYACQMQMAQIAEQIQQVQVAIEEVRQGLEYDRLATAYSCQQKLLQAMRISNPELKRTALLRIAFDAEDSRNRLMQSQKATIALIHEHPEGYIAKFFSTSSGDKVASRIDELRCSLSAVNLVSMTEAMAYQELGETEAARQSLLYYADYIHSTFLSVEGFAERLDEIDRSSVDYWSNSLPMIEKRIQSLPCVENRQITGGNYGEKEV